MGLGSKLFMGTKSSRISPQFDGITRARSASVSSDDSVSTGIPTPGSVKSFEGSSARSLSSTWASSRPSSGSLVSSQRRRRPVSLSRPAEERKKFNGKNDLSHLVAPVMPWSDFIAIYAEFLTSSLGGEKQSWINFMSLGTSDVRIALSLSGNMTSLGRKRPFKLPPAVAELLTTLLRQLPKGSTADTAKLCFTLHTRPFYCTSLNPHVELLLWGVMAVRNDWLQI